MPPAITTHKLSKRFGGTTAVDSVDLEVAAGEVFGLVGPNGAGKTTLLQLLAALRDPTAGSAAVLGYDVVRNAKALRQRIGYVAQEFTLYGTLTVEENLDFFADLYGVPAAVRKSRQVALLAWSRLTPFRQRRAARLSGGMQKKLHLCCTLIHEPDLLLLDEPTTGVDPVSRRELWESLYDLVGRGMTLVVATPYMDEAERCHRVALMHRGKLLRCDSPEVLRLEVNQIAWELRTRNLARAQELLQDAGLSLQLHHIGDHLRLVAPAAVEVPTTVRRLLAAGDGADLHLRQVSLTMEDVFVAVVTRAMTAAGGQVGRHGAAPQSQVKWHADGVAVRVEDLTRTFGTFVAVDHISLSVQRGEVFGFLGPNGSGKTTTIRMLCGLLPPSAGRGQVLGHDIRRQVRRIKSRLGYMSQRFSLYNDLTVGENLAFFGGGYGLSSRRLAERLAQVLEMAGLQGEERRLVQELSGGVKQRLALACAILHEPEILFLDEPTAGVDPLSRRQFWDLIDSLAATGVTVFVTTHYMDEAENCHRLGLIYRGRLVAVGSLHALKQGMQAGVMLELACPDPFMSLRLLRAQPSLSGVNLFGRRLHVLVEDAAAAEAVIRQTLQAAGLEVEHLEPIPLSLEDLFVLRMETEEHTRRAADG
jgi:ABC-2 type transport system ATP-binding protein